MSVPGNDEDIHLATLMAAMEPLLGLTLNEAWRPNVLGFLKMAQSAAALYIDLPYDDASDEPLPVFVPGAP